MRVDAPLFSCLREKTLNGGSQRQPPGLSRLVHESEMKALGRLMLPRIDKEGDDGFFAKRLGGLQLVQTLNKHEARAVRPY